MGILNRFKKDDKGQGLVENELNSIRDGVDLVFGQGSKWENTYTSGLDKKYIQVSDIDMSGFSDWVPIGYEGKSDPTLINKLEESEKDDSFSGVYDGGGNIIKNFTMNDELGYRVGLFGTAENAMFENIGLENVNISCRRDVGGLVGSLVESKIINSYVEGNVTGRTEVGGLAGYIGDSDIVNSYSDVTVNGFRSVGGLVGAQSGSSTIINSHTLAEVSGTGGIIGGLAGYQRRGATIRNSYMIGEVKGDGMVGGLVGMQQSNSKVMNSHAQAIVVGLDDSTYIGGLVGYQYGGAHGGSLISDSGWDSEKYTGEGIGGGEIKSNNIKGYSSDEIEDIIGRLIK